MEKIFDYLDYRRFLKERISQLRESGKFSYRNFSRHAGFRSSGTLKLVMDGKRNLAQEGIFKVAKGLRLNNTELKFFNQLVLMNQAKSHEEKDYHFKQLTTYRPFRKARELTALQYDCLSRWFYAAILELVRLPDFQEDPDWISRRLEPRMTLTEIRRTITDLEQLGFLVRDEEGRLRRSETTVSTPDEVKSLSLIRFHKEMCDLAKRAVELTASQRREFSSLTIAVSKEGFQKVKQRIQEFKKELDSYLEEDSSPRNHVAQVNLQIFLLTKENHHE